MLEAIVLWAIVSGQPKAVFHWAVADGDVMPTARVEEFLMGMCERERMALQAIGHVAWCVPQRAL